MKDKQKLKGSFNQKLNQVWFFEELPKDEESLLPVGLLDEKFDLEF